MNKRTVLMLFVAWLLPAAAFTAVAASTSGGSSPTSTQYLEWVDLVPEIERSNYRPGPPPPLHGYLDDFRGRSFGRFDQDDPQCRGVAARFDPDCEPSGQQWLSGNVNQSLNGKTISLRGYIVPLELSRDGKLTEFFIAPYVGACIHVPPPAPNQLIYVKVPKGERIDSIYDAYAVTGVLHAQIKSVGLNAAAYTLDLKSIRRVR